MMKKQTLLTALTLILSPVFSYAATEDISLHDNISLHKDTYFLPYYHEENVNQLRFKPLNPNGPIDASNDFIQFQISFKYKMIGTEQHGLYFAYTQKSNWSSYDKSAYFRDNDFNPEIFYKYKLNELDLSFGVEHQSNGAGGINEVSWNRGFIDLKFIHDYGYIRIKPWVRIENGFDYNPDIENFMRYGELELGFIPRKNNEIKFLLRNMTKDKDYNYSVSWKFPLLKNVNGYLKYEDGYGLSISNYNFKTNAFGAGVSVNF